MTAGYFKDTYFVLHPKLYRVAFAILRNEADAEDILQDAYCKLWDERNKLVDIQKPEAYCVIIIRNLCMDFLRAHQTKRLFDDIEPYDLPDPADNAETDVINRETIEKVKDTIRRLPEKQQRVLDLRAFAGCSSEEIEQITGESSKNVRVLLSRARNTLKIKLKHLLYD